MRILDRMRGRNRLHHYLVFRKNPGCLAIKYIANFVDQVHRKRTSLI